MYVCMYTTKAEFPKQRVSLEHFVLNGTYLLYMFKEGGVAVTWHHFCLIMKIAS